MVYGYAEDVIGICEALGLRDVPFIRHLVSSMTGSIAAIERPSRVGRLVLICPSPSFFNDPPDNYGGFERGDLLELIDLIDRHFIGRANYRAPVVMATSRRTEVIFTRASRLLSESYVFPRIAEKGGRMRFCSACWRHVTTGSRSSSTS